MYLDTLALATFFTGDAAKALELQEKAVKMMDEKATSRSWLVSRSIAMPRASEVRIC